MDFDPDTLISGYLDETLTAEQVIALNDWLRNDADNARRFAAVGLLHDRLRNRFASDGALDATFSEVARPRSSTRLRFGKRPVFLSATAAALVVVVLIVIQAVNSHRTLAAEADLDRLIAVSTQTVDRCYRIRSLNEPQPPGPPPDQDPLRIRPPIDGALLYTRGNDEHVLIRRFADGRTFVTGSNGLESWAIPPEGPVKVSADPTRYRAPRLVKSKMCRSRSLKPCVGSACSTTFRSRKAIRALGCTHDSWRQAIEQDARPLARRTLVPIGQRRDRSIVLRGPAVAEGRAAEPRTATARTARSP